MWVTMTACFNTERQNMASLARQYCASCFQISWKKAWACLLSPNNRKHVSLLAPSTSSMHSCVFLSLPVPRSTGILIPRRSAALTFWFWMSFTSGPVRVGLLCLCPSGCERTYSAVSTCMFACASVHVWLYVCLCACWSVCVCVLVFARAPVCLTAQRVWLFLFQTTLLPLSPSLCLLLSR